MKTTPIQFGSVTLAHPVVLAPMAGYTDCAMRSLCLEHGAGAVYTELISAEGLRREQGGSVEMMEATGREHPIAGHLFGADPQSMAEAARIVEASGRYDWIDINCGCPVKKVVSRGAGAALIKDLPLMGRIIEAVKATVSLPVSVKTRIGFSQDGSSHLEIARTIEESGADMLSVHARLAKNFHGGDPDWEKLGEIKQSVAIPLLGNGGVFSPADAVEMVRVAAVDGVMIGRGAIGNPWIFERIRAALAGAAVPAAPPSARERREMMAEHLRRLVALNENKRLLVRRRTRYTPEEAACIQFRTHIPYYIRGMYGKKELLIGLAQMMSVGAILEAVDRLVEKNDE